MPFIKQLAGILIPERLGDVIDQLFRLRGRSDQLAVNRNGGDIIANRLVGACRNIGRDIVRNDAVDSFSLFFGELIELKSFG